MWHTFKHFIHMQYFLLPTNLVIIFVHWVSTRVLYKPWQCSLFWDYIPESKLCFCLNLCRPPGTYSIRPIQKLLNCQQLWRDDARCPGCYSRHSSRWGATKNSAVALSSRNNMISIHQRSARTNEAEQRWFKVTQELCHEWFHHFRHHVHDGHWTGEFATIIWRLHCFTVSFRGDVRGESGPR